MLRKKRLAAAASSLLPLLLACHVNRGSVAIAPPTVYSDAVTRASLKAQGARVFDGAKAVAAGGIQQFSSARDGARVNVLVAGGFSETTEVTIPDDADTPPSTKITANPVNPPSAPSGALPPAAVPTPGLADYRSLFSEVLRDLQDREVALEAARLLYVGDERLNGLHSRAYLVRLDVAVAPDRQPLHQYVWRWLDLAHGFRNYTKDHEIELTFVIPPLQAHPAKSSGAGDSPLDPTASDLQVYAVFPGSEVVTSLDGYASLLSMALAARGGAGGAQAGLDYLREAERQFAELRRYSVVRGTIVSPTEFRFRISPRRRLQERGWFMRLLTGQSQKVVRRLEPQVHSLFVVLVGREVDSYSIAPEGMESFVARLCAGRPEYYAFLNIYRGADPFESREKPADLEVQIKRTIETESETGAGTTSEAETEGMAPRDPSASAPGKDAKPALAIDHLRTIPIAVSCSYYEVDDAQKPIHLPFDGFARYPSELATWRRDGSKSPRIHDADIEWRVLPVKLPLATAGERSELSIRAVPERPLLLALRWPGKPLARANISILESPVDGGGVSTREWTRSKAKLVPFAVHADDRVTFTIQDPPPKPEKGHVEFLIQVSCEGELGSVTHAFRGPWGVARKLPSMTPSFGVPGELVTIVVPRSDSANQFGSLLFGGVQVQPGNVKVEGDIIKVTFLAPTPPRSPFAPVVNVVLETLTVDGKAGDAIDLGKWMYALAVTAPAH